MVAILFAEQPTLVTKDPAGQSKVRQGQSNRWIDGMQALAQAMVAAKLPKRRVGSTYRTPCLFEADTAGHP
jgi:hypothetical protein